MTRNSIPSKYAVLIVEDDPLVRLDAVDMIEDAGFIAYEAANAEEAFTLLERHADIRIVFTDIEMPGSMDGLKLAHAVRKRWPSMTTFVTSGRVAVTKSELPDDGYFFPKPYQPSAIIRLARDVTSRLP